MSRVRALLGRARKLERARSAPAIIYLATEEFEACVRRGVAEGQLDGMDMFGKDGDTGVLGAVKGWVSDRVWEVAR